MDRVDAGLDWLWRFLTSMRLGMVLMLAIAALGVAGSLLMQMPGATTQSPELRAEWLESVRPRYGGWTNILNTLQLFEVFSSVLFRVLVAALTISLVACSIHRIPGMVRTTRNPRVDVGPAFFEHAPQHEAIVARRSAAETREVVEGVLRARRYRILASDDGTLHLYGDRFRYAPFAGLIAHIAIVVILAGAMVGGAWGYHNAGFVVSEGQTMPIEAEPGLSMRLEDFTDRWDPVTGAPIDYASTVVLLKDGAEVASHVVRVNDPLRYNGLAFYQADYGSSAVMTIKDASGKALLSSEGVALAWSTTDEGRPVGSANLLGTSYVAWVSGTMGGSDQTVAPGQVRVEIYDGTTGNLVDEKVVTQGEAATVAGLDILFERESQHTVLSIARDPGVPLIWIGAMLLFGGFLIRFMVPHKRVWGRIVARPNGGAVVGMATLTHKDVAAGSEFETVVNDIRSALQAPAQS
jgi:cytochrome c biogenesis protein